MPGASRDGRRPTSRARGSHEARCSPAVRPRTALRRSTSRCPRRRLDERYRADGPGRRRALRAPHPADRIARAVAAEAGDHDRHRHLALAAGAGLSRRCPRDRRGPRCRNRRCRGESRRRQWADDPLRRHARLCREHISSAIKVVAERRRTPARLPLRHPEPAGHASAGPRCDTASAAGAAAIVQAAQSSSKRCL